MADLRAKVEAEIENILKQILRQRGVLPPAGDTWHRALLDRAQVEGIRSSSAQQQLAPYLAFRHFFTHAYGFDLDSQRLEPLARDIVSVWHNVARQVRAALDAAAPPPPASKPTD